MTKSVKPQPKVVEGNKPKAVLAHLQTFTKWAKASAKKHRRGIACLLALILFGALAIFTGENLFSGFGAALYIFANDGKISGRQSGSVKTRNGVERMFVVPRLVRNTYTTMARNLFTGFSTGWRSLTSVQRDTWNNALGVFKSNRFGVPFPLKGKALFIERNTNLANVGVAQIDEYNNHIFVVPMAPTDAAFITTAGVLTTANIVFADSPVPAGVAVKVFATAPLPASISRPRNSAFKQIAVMNPTDTTPFDILAAYTSRFGNIASIGDVVGVRLALVDTDSGWMNTPVDFLGEVT